MRSINRRDFIRNIASGSLAFAVGGCFSDSLIADRPADKKPNFLFILVDDLGWTDLGCFGSSFYETPNIDRLCKESVKFTNAYAACPVCSPTRASIMAGKYPARMGTTDFFGAIQPDEAKKRVKYKPLLPAPYRDQLPLEEVTIAEALKDGGYTTFFAGKWHLGKISESWPEHQGFDINKGGWSSGGPYGPGKYFVPYGNPRLEDGPKGEHLPDRLATETVRFITENQDKPFLAYLSFYSVHIPLMAREDLKRKYEQKREKLGLQPKWGQEGERQVRLIQEHAVYAGMVEAMDQACGKVLDALKKLKLEDNTVVFFMSDNGGLSTAEGHPTSNLPLRAGKGWLYEGGIREPVLVKWPGITRPGSVCSQPVTSTDFYPTILEIADLPARPKQHLDGKSWVPLLKGDKKIDRGPLFWHYPHYSNQGGSPGSAIRDGDWKLIVWYEDNRQELYHLKDDVGEHKNLLTKKPEIANKLYDKLQTWLKEVNAIMPSPNPNTKRK